MKGLKDLNGVKGEGRIVMHHAQCEIHGTDSSRRHLLPIEFQQQKRYKMICRHMTYAYGLWIYTKNPQNALLIIMHYIIFVALVYF